MLPLVLDLSRLRLVLVGNGAASCRRLALLDEAGARALAVFAAAPSTELVAASGARLRPHWPSPDELGAAQLVFIADAPSDLRPVFVAQARSAGALVHVEDMPELSDALAPAVLRRGDLTIAISTGGGSPGLAAALKHFLGEVIGPEWQGRLDELATLRRQWRRSGALPAVVGRRTMEWIARRGWLPATPPAFLATANDRADTQEARPLGLG
jgi:precorrin-2 dehydrogenase / sirohydrochlorin ferrochelatase